MHIKYFYLLYCLLKYIFMLLLLYFYLINILNAGVLLVIKVFLHRKISEYFFHHCLGVMNHWIRFYNTLTWGVCYWRNWGGRDIESPVRREARVMVGGATRPLIGRRGVGSEQQAAKYGKRSSVRTGTVWITVLPLQLVTERKPTERKQIVYSLWEVLSSAGRRTQTFYLKVHCVTFYSS